MPFRITGRAVLGGLTYIVIFFGLMAWALAPTRAQIVKPATTTHTHPTVADDARFQVLCPQARPIDMPLYCRKNADGSWDHSQLDQAQKSLKAYAEYGIGRITLFGNFYTEEERPIKVGSKVTYLYKNPGRIHEFVQAAHEHGFLIYGYIHPHFSLYEADNRTPRQDLHQFREMVVFLAGRHGWDGVYLDGLGVGRTPEERVQTLRYLKYRLGRGSLYGHVSVDPSGGRAYHGPETDELDFGLWGETNLRPDGSPVSGPSDPYLTYMMMPDTVVWAWKPNGGKFDEGGQRTHAADLMTTEWFLHGRVFRVPLWLWPSWVEFGYPRWREAQAIYAADVLAAGPVTRRVGLE